VLKHLNKTYLRNVAFFQNYEDPRERTVADLEATLVAQEELLRAQRHHRGHAYRPSRRTEHLLRVLGWRFP